MLVAPATNNMIAKVAHGLCDDLVSLMICAAACPVIFAPSMNDRMWANPITQENVAKLTKLNYRFIGPESGCNVGMGRRHAAIERMRHRRAARRACEMHEQPRRADGDAGISGRRRHP